MKQRIFYWVKTSCDLYKALKCCVTFHNDTAVNPKGSQLCWVVSVWPSAYTTSDYSSMFLFLMNHIPAEILMVCEHELLYVSISHVYSISFDFIHETFFIYFSNVMSFLWGETDWNECFTLTVWDKTPAVCSARSCHRRTERIWSSLLPWQHWGSLMYKKHQHE